MNALLTSQNYDHLCADINIQWKEGCISIQMCDRQQIRHFVTSLMHTNATRNRILIALNYDVYVK